MITAASLSIFTKTNSWHEFHMLGYVICDGHSAGEHRYYVGRNQTNLS